MKSINRLVPLLLLLLGYSCIGDDMDDCPVEIPQVKMEFSYTKNMSGNDSFREETDTLLVTLYNNADDRYATHYRVAQDQLENGNLLSFSGLPDGSYTAVAWAKSNCGDYQAQNYTTQKQNMCTRYLHSLGQVSPQAGKLFHGMAQIYVQDGSATAHVDMTKNTSGITIRLAEQTATTARPVAIGDYKIEITASNGSYNYDNTLTAAQPQLAYIQDYSVAAFDTLQSQCRMLRLFPGDDSKLQIRDGAGNIIPILDQANNAVTNPVSLTAQLMRNPLINTQDDLDMRDHFTLTYSINRHTDGQLTISLTGIDDWSVNSGNPGI